MPDLQFDGERLAHATTKRSGASRWTELTIYLTSDRQFVCESVGRSDVLGERDFHEVRVCGDDDAVVAFFGHGSLANELYAAVGIEPKAEILGGAS